MSGMWLDGGKGMTVRSWGLGFLALAGCVFLWTTAGYMFYAFLDGRLYEPIIWIRTTEEVYTLCLTMLGIVGAILIGRGLFRR
jgi:hypothetical protein